jgi:hypothetical protein
MKSYKFLLLVLLFVAAAVAMSAMRGQGQNNSAPSGQDNLKKAAEDFYTITDYDAPEPADPQKRVLRRARGRRHNMRLQKGADPKRFMITEQMESSFGTPPFDVPIEPALPVTASDVVVVGELTGAQAHLSEDKTSVYSEFTIAINDVLKSNSSALITAGASIDAERYGGAVRFASGKIIRFGDWGRAFPQRGRRYLFFLKYNDEGQDFSIITAYELRAGRVFPLDGMDKEGTTLSRYPNYLKYRDTDEQNFLNEVRQAIANGSDGGR